MRNIVAQGGFAYSKYLKKQLAEVMENAHVHKNYNMADLHIHQDQSQIVVLEDGTIVPVENLQRYTRITGALFDRWGLTKENYLTDAKIDQVCAIELGEDERTAGHIKPVLRNYKTVMGADGYPVEVHSKDIKNGYYMDQYGSKIHFDKKDVKTKSGFKKKTAIELVFSHDQSFSHAGALMDADDQVKLAKLWMDCAEASYKECFSQYLETYHGIKGETGASLYFHNDARSGNVHHHVHLNISNVIRLEDGTIMAIEMPAMRQKNFHQAMDAMFKNKFVSMWQEQFGDKYPVEAYDKDRQAIKADDKFKTQDIENHRVAFTDDILEVIRQRSKSKELIDKAISQQKRDEYERAELRRMAVQEKFDALEAKLAGIELPTNYGVILSHGAAPYQNDKTKSMSYFVELELANGKTKKIWSKDIEQAISNANLKVGDFAGFSQTGETAVKVKDEQGQWVDGVRKTWEATDLSAYKAEMDTLADLDSQIKAINKGHEAAIKRIDSVKNRDAVWQTIKQKKKAIGKELKDVELHKEAVQLGSSIKSERDRGAIYAPKDDAEILEKLTDTNPFFTKFDLIIELSKHQAMGSKADEIAEQKLKEWAELGLLISKEQKPVEDGKPKRKKTFSKQSAKKKEPVYPMQHTTKALARQEYFNVKTSTKLVENMGFKGVEQWRKHIADAIKAQPKGRRFNALQVELMKAVVQKDGSRLVLCEGFPGTGKSTVMGTAIEILQQQAGADCLVLAPTGKVAASAGVDTTANHTGTIDQWLIGMESGKTTIKNNSVIFIDESSMIGTKNYYRFMKHINKAVADGIDVKVVLIGDTNQIQSVQSGNTYTNIIKENQSKVRYLRKIIRQKDETSLAIAQTTSLSNIAAEEMAAVKKSGAHVEQSWKMIEDSGRLLEYETTTDKNNDTANRYLADTNRTIDKVILCATNEDVKALNELIQEKRLLAGEIGGRSIENHEESFYVGDRVMVNKNSKEYKNGDFGIITKIHDDGSFDVEFGEGKNSKIKTMKDPAKIALAAAISIHKSQGLTVNNVWLNGTESPVVDQELWNVAQTRARYITWTAVVKSEKAKVLEAFKRENSKENLYELALEQEAIAKAQQKTPQAPAVAPNQVEQLDRVIEATKAATAAVEAPTTVSQPGRPNLLAALRTKFKSFGKISNAVFSPRKPPVAIIKQRQAAELAAQQAKAQQQVQTAQKQEQARQAELARQAALKKSKNKGLQL
jgi:hypothetical protein